MSVTGTWSVPARAVELTLAELGQWRRACANELAEFRRWATVGRSIDEQTAARLAHLERRLLGERLTVAFVAEYSRGKSELINALFFADLGELLPSGLGRTTLCPTEVLWDPARPPSLRLLPIETRSSPQALRSFMGLDDAWHEVALDLAKPESLAACQAISATRTATPAEAALLGLAEGDEVADLEIPRWRYAIVNLPHPALENGLVILDMPGHNTIGSEPEITMNRLPDAAAIVFLLGADTGVTRSDSELWSEHIEPIQGAGSSCYVVLNKIDGLRDGFKPETQVLAEIEKQVRGTADALRIAPARVFPLSARQGLLARMKDDREGIIRSRIYRLEQALARGLVQERRRDHAAAVRAESRVAFAESSALIESRLAFANEQLEEIAAIQGKNQHLLEALARRAAAERVRLEQARASLMELRTAHNRHAADLARLLDPNQARAAGAEAKARVLSSRFSRQIGEALDEFFRKSRAQVGEAVAVILEAHALMDRMSHRFRDEYRIASVEVADFPTERFVVELDRLEAACARDFKGAGSLLTRGRSTLGARFFDTVALNVVRVFEIAGRESRTWMAGFIRPLEAQVADFQEQANARIEGMARIRNAEVDLVARLDELKVLAADVAAQLAQSREYQQRLMALLAKEL
ncbi:MAG TPA: dynamin family protein [Usitatibacter sp.]|nr:dynamin family protein [Usitatibacter sp.]